MKEFDFSLEIPVKIRVQEDSDAITRVTGPDGDGWRANFYDLHTQQDVFEMWAYNAIVNNIHDVSRLDGWGDMADGEATVKVSHE